MKLHFDPAMLLLTLALAGPAIAGDEQWTTAGERRAYLVAPAAEPAFRWAADKVSRRTRADTLIWRGNAAAVARAQTFRRSGRDPGLVLERP